MSPQPMQRLRPLVRMRAHTTEWHCDLCNMGGSVGRGNVYGGWVWNHVHNQARMHVRNVHEPGLRNMLTAIHDTERQVAQRAEVVNEVCPPRWCWVGLVLSALLVATAWVVLLVAVTR